MPPAPDKVYAVVNVKGQQHKVVKDSKIMLEILDDSYEVGQQLVFDDVLMVGTKDYTAVGRPSVENARVFVTLEEITRSEKVIVFKKKRRKG